MDTRRRRSSAFTVFDYPSLREQGAFDIELEVLLQTEKMRADGTPPQRLSLSNFRHSIGPWRKWSHITPSMAVICKPVISWAQGTQSGPRPEEAGSLL